MKILIDSADINEITALYKKFHFDGVTTNPKLLSRVDGNPLEILKEIRKNIPEDSELHVQVVSSTKEEMILEAEYILKNLGENTCIKIPVCEEGYSVIRYLSSLGVQVTATAIFSEAQALMAAHEGASFVAPYIHRINNKGYKGVETALEIQKGLIEQGCKTELLAAAFESVQQVIKIIKSGAGSVTVSPELLKEMLFNAMTADAITDFYCDFSKKFNQKNMLG